MSLSLPSEPSRENLKRAFLARNGFGDLRRQPLPGDASTRSYERLHRPGGGTLILMDQPAQLETVPCPDNATPEERVALGYNASARLAAGRVGAFVAAAAHLAERGLSAPRVLTFDAAQGFAVLEDLGDDLFALRIARGEPERPLYEDAVDVLARLHAEPPPAVLEGWGAAWPLFSYDRLAFEAGLDPFLEWWPAFSGLPVPDADAAAEWSALWSPVLAMGEEGASVFAHRDYHAENLLWLPDREGVARVGLLDFQDALRAHPAWDLLHLLQDARRDVPPELETAMLDRFLAARPDLHRDTFVHEYRALAAVNAARILGRVFARQEVLFNRGKYRAFMPRAWRHLERDLELAGLAGLTAWFDRQVPRETRP